MKMKPVSYAVFFTAIGKSDGGIVMFNGIMPEYIMIPLGKLPSLEDIKRAMDEVKERVKVRHPDCFVSVTGCVPCATPKR